MRIVFKDGTGEAERRLVVHPAQHPTVGHLHEALTGAPPPEGAGLELDGRFVDAASPLDAAGLLEGTVVRVATRARATGWPATTELAVVAGVAAGARLPVRAGRHVVGRDPNAAGLVVGAPTVSARHAVLELHREDGVTIGDLGSRHGTFVDGQPVEEPTPVEPGSVVRLGGVEVRVRRPPSDTPVELRQQSDAGGIAGTRPFNRPPRPAAPEGPAPLTLPTRKADNERRNPFSWILLFAPLAFAGVIVAVTRNPLFALFGLLSPVMTVGNYVEQRRRAKRSKQENARNYAEALVTLEHDVTAAGAVELARRRLVLPDVAEVLRRAEAPSARLWERRPDHGDLGVASVGLGTVRWDPPTDAARLGAPEPEVSDVLDRTAVLADCPVAVSFTPGSAVGVHGERSGALGVARDLLCQLAVQSGPADLRIVVLSEPGRIGDWDWTRWLPHTRDVGRPGDARLVTDRHDVIDAVVRGVLEEAAEKGGPARTVVVLDGDTLLEGRLSPVRPLLANIGHGRVSALVLADAPTKFPASATSLVNVGADGGARVTHPQAGRVVEPVLAAVVDEPTARTCARHLARYDDPDQELAGAGLPQSLSLPSLFTHDVTDPEAILEAWDGDDPLRTLGAPVGVGDGGVVVLDLDRVGPHALIAGTTGSGKSELLRTMVAGLALSLDCEDVSFLLVDFKGGSAFDACGRLPHCVGVVTDLDDGLAERALRALEVELRRRERALRAAGAEDLPTHRRLRQERRAQGGPVPDPMPRLVIVVDEFATLAAELPGFVDSLVGVAQRGRSLGMHLVLATQRPGGSVSRDIQANTALRISLRVADERDSMDVLGSPAAARIGRGQAGRALLRTDAFDLAPFQVASVTLPVDESDAGAVPVVALALDADPVRDGVPRREGRNPLPRVVEAVTLACDMGGRRRPDALWDPESGNAGPTETIPLEQLLPFGPLRDLDPVVSWKPREGRDFLRVPIGVDDGDEPVLLDIKESAQGGAGPHGLVVGATGSGKSELLRTLVASLVATHSPEDLALVLVDFKGGATFAGLAELPHVAGMITNLADDESMIDRFHDALFGEQRRRQELLKQAGNLTGIRELRAARAAGRDVPVMPHLFVVVDEFAELLATRPDFIDLFVAIGRLGRSLGVHLLFSSQQLDEGRLRGLEGHISYRMALRTFSVADSRAVLGSGEAATLPPEPGLGYLKGPSGNLERFKAALVSGPAGDPDDPGLATLDAVVSRLEGAAERVHQVWLAPLDGAVTLDQLMGPMVRHAELGAQCTAWPERGKLKVPIGIVDRPAEQRRTMWLLDLAGNDANVVVVGAPQSGKTGTLRTILTGLFATHTPWEVQAYLIDHGGGGLAAYADDPHVGAIADRSDPALTTRIVREVLGILDQREASFRSVGIDSAAAFRRARAERRITDTPFGDVFLVVDGWPSLRQAQDEIDPMVAQIAARGPGYGVHVLLTANRWMELRANVRDSLSGQVELRLAEAAESIVDRRTARTVPLGRPGRALTATGHHAQLALGRVDGVADGDDVASAIVSTSKAIATAWTGDPAPPVRLLPDEVTDAHLPAVTRDGGHGVHVGLGEGDLQPLELDLSGADPHLIVYGDGESGKTTFLERFVRRLLARAGDDRVAVLVVDPRRTLLDLADLPGVVSYAGSAQQAAAEVQSIHRLLTARQPGPDVTTAELKARSWWKGPEVYVVVDDHDLLVTPQTNPLLPLVEFLAQGRDLGLHVVVARRVAGASRAAFEPMVQRLRELGGPSLLLSGDPQEGPVVGGIRARQLPAGRGTLVRRRSEPEQVQLAR